MENEANKSAATKKNKSSGAVQPAVTDDAAAKAGGVNQVTDVAQPGETVKSDPVHGTGETSSAPAPEMAALIALLEAPEVIEVIGKVVVQKLREVLPPIVEVQLLEHLTGDDAIVVGPSNETVLTMVKGELPHLIEELVPSVRAEREQEAAREQAAESAVTAREAERRRLDEQEKQAGKDRAKRQKDVGRAQESFGRVFGADNQTEGFGAKSEGIAELLLDDGKGFCIDYRLSVDTSDLADQDGMIRLKPSVQLPDDVPAFVVRGVSLHLGDYAVRCEIPTPLHIGEGRSAHLAADSLVFRAPIASA